MAVFIAVSITGDTGSRRGDPDPAFGAIGQLAPFCDFGRSWNTNRGEPSPRTLASVGVGLRTTYRFLRGEIYWGHRLQHVEDPGDGGIRDDGVTFALVASF